MTDVGKNFDQYQVKCYNQRQTDKIETHQDRKCKKGGQLRGSSLPPSRMGVPPRPLVDWGGGQNMGPCDDNAVHVFENVCLWICHVLCDLYDLDLYDLDLYDLNPCTIYKLPTVRSDLIVTSLLLIFLVGPITCVAFTVKIGHYAL